MAVAAGRLCAGLQSVDPVAVASSLVVSFESAAAATYGIASAVAVDSYRAC